MSWTHLKDMKPVARKRYQCLLCEGFIEPGEKHVARTGIGEAGPETFRMHSLCESLTHDWDDWEWECQSPADFRSDLLKPALAKESTR